MSWLNNSLNSLKGQLTTLAQEVLAETAGPGDEEYRGVNMDAAGTKTSLELLAETQNKKEKLDKLCNDKEQEIALLRKQINELQHNTGDRGAAAGVGSAPVAITRGGSGTTTKSPTDNNTKLEDSWYWEPDGAKHDSSSESSGNGNEMVNIVLDEVPLGASSKSQTKLASSALQRRVQQLEKENKQLNAALEELDNQHNIAMQNVLELKIGLQTQLSDLTKQYEALTRDHARTKQEMTAQIDAMQATEKHRNEFAAELQARTEEMHSLMVKKDQDNIELIQRVRASAEEVEQSQQEREGLMQKINELLRKIEEIKNKTKEKKTSESSTSSTGKQSEDEFIVVRDGDANSSGPTTPPTKEELKDKIVQLENRLSELTLENGSLALKLQDVEMEKELAANVLTDNIQELRNQYIALEEQLNAAKEQLTLQVEKVNSLKEKAAEAVIAQEQLKASTESKTLIEAEMIKMKERLGNVAELKKRLLFSEREKESLQMELQALRTAQARVIELESRMQKLTMDNQQLTLNAEAETESVNNSNELEDRLKALTEENDSLRTELDNIAQAKFRQAIAEEKQEITDLDAEEDDHFSMDALRDLLAVYMKQDLTGSHTEVTEKTFRALRERLWKNDNLQKSLAQMSEEIADLQDCKLVWNHEKKTLEADISQYILQCDELMKNNEILLNELDNYKRNKLETISENNEENVVQLETQLEECSKLNRTLEEEYSELNEKVEELQREKQSFNERLQEAQMSKEKLIVQERDFRLQLETLELEKCNMMFELNELKSTNDRGNNANGEDLRNAVDKCQILESQLARLSSDHTDLIATLQVQKTALFETNRKREETEAALHEKEAEVECMRHEMQQMQQHAKETATKLSQITSQDVKTQEEMLADDLLTRSLQNEVKQLQMRLMDLNTMTLDRDRLHTELNETQTILKNLQHKMDMDTATAQSLRAECEELKKGLKRKETLEQDFNDLMEKYTLQQIELITLQETAATATKTTDVEAVARIAQLEGELLATVDLEKQTDALKYEKNEMIKVLQQKHAENMQYYMEIQRLQSIVQQLQQQQLEAKSCNMCPTLTQTIGELRSDQEKLQDQINFLKEKSDILTTNLLTEQTNQRLVQQEKAEVQEQNVVIRKDAERLRQHLLEIEEMHTQESVEMQKELDATRTKMIALQEDVSKSSTAYTSASIRANQHAETLQVQYALVVQQRDELVAKLSLAEDRESKNQAALCNLQCALEQFEIDKESEIKATTQRIRKDLQHELDKEAQLHTEIAALNLQLADANHGLRAASRLSDQLEATQQTIAALREEVQTVKEQNVTLEQKLTSSECSQTDKIDKNLIKSLLIGYIVSGSPSDKNQVLRLISSVLEFTATEADKAGLNKHQSSWLGSILGGGIATAAAGVGDHSSHSKDNLVQAFVQFLEQESQPKDSANNMPNLLNITQSSMPPSAQGTSVNAASQRRISVASNSGAGGAMPMPVQLLNTNVLPEFGPTRNSSSILKDILSDS